MVYYYFKQFKEKYYVNSYNSIFFCLHYDITAILNINFPTASSCILSEFIFLMF